MGENRIHITQLKKIIKGQSDFLKNGQIDIFPRKITNSQQVKEKVLNITNYQGNANQNYNEIMSHPLEWLLSKREERANAGEAMEKKVPLCTVGGNVNRCSYYEKQYGGSLKK